MKKYRLRKDPSGLFRVVAVRSFGNVKNGEVGGLVVSEANLSHDDLAWVSGNARVSGEPNGGPTTTPP